MGHEHSHYHEHSREHGFHHHHHGDTANLRTAFFLNLGFTVVEIIGAYLTNSVAILSDALHDLGDSIALGMPGGWRNMPARRRQHASPTGMAAFLCSLPLSMPPSSSPADCSSWRK